MARKEESFVPLRDGTSRKNSKDTARVGVIELTRFTLIDNNEGMAEENGGQILQKFVLKYKGTEIGSYIWEIPQQGGSKDNQLKILDYNWKKMKDELVVLSELADEYYLAKRNKKPVLADTNPILLDFMSGIAPLLLMPQIPDGDYLDGKPDNEHRRIYPLTVESHRFTGLRVATFADKKDIASGEHVLQQLFDPGITLDPFEKEIMSLDSILQHVHTEYKKAVRGEGNSGGKGNLLVAGGGDEDEGYTEEEGGDWQQSLRPDSEMEKEEKAERIVTLRESSNMGEHFIAAMEEVEQEDRNRAAAAAAAAAEEMEDSSIDLDDRFGAVTDDIGGQDQVEKESKEANSEEEAEALMEELRELAEMEDAEDAEEEAEEQMESPLDPFIKDYLDLLVDFTNSANRIWYDALQDIKVGTRVEKNFDEIEELEEIMEESKDAFEELANEAKEVLPNTYNFISLFAFIENEETGPVAHMQKLIDTASNPLLLEATIRKHLNKQLGKDEPKAM